MSCWRYGATLSFGTFGIGVERYMGDGNLKRWNFGDSEEGIDITSDKVKYLVSSTRFYVGIRF